MGADQINKENQANKKCNSTCMKLIQFWLTSFAIGIPSWRFLLFFDFRYSEILIVMFCTMLIFGTMYILDTNDRLLRDDDIQPCNGVADAEHINSTNYQNKMLETTIVETGMKYDEPIRPKSEPISTIVI